MQYLCVHCDEKFEHDSDERPRCPKCMRMRGLREVGAGQPAADAGGGRGSGKAVMLGAAVLIALLAGGYALYVRNALPDEATIESRPLSAGVVQRVLQERGQDAGEMASVLQPDAAVEAFAERALVGAGGGAEERAQAVTTALRARASAGAMVPWPRSEPLARPVMLPAQALEALQQDGARQRLYPLEVAALAVAALRAEGVDAMLAEAFAFPGERTPADPSGRLGYYGVTLAGAGGFFDPYGGHDQAPAQDQMRRLSDLEAIGAALALSAQARLEQGQDPAQAVREARTAVALSPSSPTVRVAQASVLLASGGTTDGQQELEAAAQMRGDAPRRHNLALVMLAAGDASRAEKELAAALEAMPDYAAAHATLASLQLARREPDQARASLQKAESLEPDLPSLPVAWAQFHAARGELPQALAQAERAVELRPHSPQPRLMLAGILRQAARYDDMRRQAREVMELVPAAQRERMRAMIRQLLGPTALEQPEDEAAAEADGAGTSAGAAPGAGMPLADPGSLDLSKGSSLLGDDDDGPSLLGGDDGEGARLKLGGDGPKLELNP